MRKVALIAVVVLFWLVGVGYATEANLAGPLTNLSLKVTYEEEIGFGSKTLSEGRSFVTVTSGITPGQGITGGLNCDPVLYFWIDLSQINISWLSPNQSSPFYKERIWTISCQPPGFISTKPEVSTTKPPATETQSVEAIAACIICPDGIGFSTPNKPTTTPTGVCNGGGPYGYGYITFTGTGHKSYNASSQSYLTTSVSATGTVGGGSFNYVGDDWASTDGTPYSDWATFPAIFTGTFSVKLTPCTPSTDPYCLIAYP